jgi:hypothetical protein
MLQASPFCKYTPMDHDDADFQSQNFQQVGEDNSNFHQVCGHLHCPNSILMTNSRTILDLIIW